MSVKYYEDSHITIYQGNCRNMAELPDESVQCVVTSPPYWGLRKYSGEQDLIWGGEPKCKHQWQFQDKETGQQHWNTGGKVIPSAERIIRNGGVVKQGFCPLCGAWKGQLGLEPTVEMYISHLVEVCREIRRVLRKDG
ncbi:hypothetical protein M1N82_00385, partial [Dehalococcoidia bacterium]|nr:hypothetical protein [Dehalococcoidia bacterium]